MEYLSTIVMPLLTNTNLNDDYLFEAIKTFLWFVVPIIVIGTICLLIRIFIKIPDFIFRKVLHLITAGMITILIVIPIHWWIAEIVFGICIIGLVVLLLIFERTSIYQKFFVEKSKHEVLISFLIFALVVTSLIAFFWGFRRDGNKYLVIIAISSWALGDAAAAILGRLIGKHKVSGKMIEGIKSVEGSIACFIFAFIISFVLLMTLMHYVWWLSLLEALSIGIVITFAELFTKKGLDNLTCPIAASIVLFLFSLI